jgi:hypothetical protein
VSRRSDKKWKRILGDSKPPPWLTAPIDRGIESGTRRDYEVLKELVPFDMLPDDHPLKKFWIGDEPFPHNSEARFELHHLADDLRVVKDVDRGRALIKKLIKDPANFGAFRYELRIAGIVGRPSRQRLIRVAAGAAGPDVEFWSQSGHKVGVACYAASLSASLAAQQQKTIAFLGRIMAVAVPNRFDVDWIYDVLFPAFPPTSEDEAEAIDLFGKLWMNATTPQLTGPRGVVVTRAGQTAERRKHDNEQRIRWSFRYPVPAAEKARIKRTVIDKAWQENTSWASGYAGYALFAVDESDFAVGFENGQLSELTDASASHHFTGFLTTRDDFIDNDKGRSRHRLEKALYLPKLDVPELHIELNTFGTNFKAFLDDGWFPVVCDLDQAGEEWIAVVTYNGSVADVRCDQLSLITLTRTIDRIRPPRPGLRPDQDPDFMTRLEQCVERLRASASVVRP